MLDQHVTSVMSLRSAGTYWTISDVYLGAKVYLSLQRRGVRVEEYVITKHLPMMHVEKDNDDVETYIGTARVISIDVLQGTAIVTCIRHDDGTTSAPAGISVETAALMLRIDQHAIVEHVTHQRLEYLPQEQWPDLHSPLVSLDSIERYAVLRGVR